MPVSYSGGSWDEAATTVDFGGDADLNQFGSVTAHVYIPQAGDLVDIGFDSPTRVPSRMVTTTAGWNTVTFDIGAASTDFAGGVHEASSLTIRVVGRSATYSGDVDVDDVTFNPLTKPGLDITAPLPDATVSSPQNSAYSIKATVTAPPSRAITSVTWATATQKGALTTTQESDQWTGDWNLWNEPEGPTGLTITATDSSGATTTVPERVLVQNSKLRIEAVTPTFDAALSATKTLSATVTPDPRFALRRGTVKVGNSSWPLSFSRPTPAGTVRAHAIVDTRAVPDGVESVVFSVTDAHFTVRDTVTVTVVNHPTKAQFVTAKNGVFRVGRTQERFVGGNDWTLPLYQDMTTTSLQVGADGAVIPKGTTMSWKEQVDRDMLSAEQHHITWLRTLAFNDNPTDPAAFRTSLTGYNESAFQRLDYVLASAQRHNVRLTLVLTNNWADYGGIHQYAQWLGLPDDNAFYTDPTAISAYRAYVAHLVDRTNTVTGQRYADDPTIFSWELMNEPRYACTANACDESGATLRGWIADQSNYIKSLDPNHMVSAGSEGHGLIHTTGGDVQWAGQTEGDGNDPFLTQNVPGIDFFTFHPYLNAGWFNPTPTKANQMVNAFVKTAQSLGKPLVMEEYAFDRNAPLYSDDHTLLRPTDAAFTDAWTARTESLNTRFFAAGGGASGIWALTNSVDPDFSVNLYLPESGVRQSQPLIDFLSRLSQRLNP
ncbi:cellulase (glycosyl hydrolase family 5) [Curtobacterium sp. PhB130]|uniref:glycoside hydrolase 5 family protein n=1 Tax=unclassified Curtobacterium TaxID=257496 RepID=UPI000FA9EE37|nr:MULTISPECIES: cellulase family glycosylhydrolase [unclassified Curtobacterium]ROS71858.1 cellulase (glycosyl hydrolase family 5) [Curtobacterium sp. PhB130]TCK58252.1 cellulase (glycosyl hydrolase family 5) [Curtobacterium sp. PhB136]